MASRRIKKDTIPSTVPDFSLNEGSVSDMPVTSSRLVSKSIERERKLEEELFNKFEPTKILDAYEESLGILPKKDKEPKFIWRSVVLQPESVVDKEKLANLMNDPKYWIRKWDQSFSARGDIKIFIIYGERVEEKPSVMEIK